MKKVDIILCFICIIYSSCFFSCQKEVQINLTSEEEQLVVTGYIQERYPTYVFLSKSQNYFAPIDDNTLINIAIDDAKVSVEDLNGGGDHLQVNVTSQAFAGLSLVRQHQLVYSALREELASEAIHALALRTSVPK